MPPIPTLMSHLNSEYQKFMRHLDRLARPKYEGVPGFIAFCEKYLAQLNPPADVFYPANSIGLRLSNNARVVLSHGPGVQQSGQMQDSTSVGITTGDEESEAGGGGVVGI